MKLDFFQRDNRQGYFGRRNMCHTRSETEFKGIIHAKIGSPHVSVGQTLHDYHSFVQLNKHCET